MALSILDGNQSATTLSTILSSGQHITAHTVVSLGTQAITDMRGAVSGSVVSISNFPSTQTIAGTVTAQTDLDTSTGAPCVVLGFGTPAGVSRVSYNNGFPVQILNTSGEISTGNPLPIFGTVTIGSALPAGTNRIGVVTIGAGTVTIGNDITLLGMQANGFNSNILNGAGIPVYFRTTDGDAAGGDFPISGTVTIGNTVTIAGTVTANPTGTQTIAGSVTIGAGTAQIGSVTASISNSVTIASLPAISGTVTANSSNGSLTTRFGSVTTANTAFATSAVTNANRKYLLIQNVTTASNVITVGVGFTPTTTQGIQLTAGAGLTFEGNYIPTGAVNLLSSVTASCFTILEA
jgi:fibronectin-binding autotransporter adhesin